MEIMPAEQAFLPLVCTGIEVNNDPSIDAEGDEWALTIAPFDKVTTLLVRQSRVCFRGLASISKPAAYPTHPSPLTVPFMRLPNSAEFEETTQFYKAIKELLPLRLIMGTVQMHTATPSAKNR